MGTHDIEEMSGSSFKRASKHAEGYDPQAKALQDTDKAAVHLYPPLASKRAADKEVPAIAAVMIQVQRRMGKKEEAEGRDVVRTRECYANMTESDLAVPMILKHWSRCAE